MRKLVPTLALHLAKLTRIVWMYDGSTTQRDKHDYCRVGHETKTGA